jgi:hypothetical protein
MENKVLKGIVVCAFKVVKGTNEPLKTPYGFIHPESDESFEALLNGAKPIGAHIRSIAKDENIQFVLRSCKLEAAQIACGNNDEVNKGDLVTFTYHTDSANGFPQARDVKLVKPYWRPTPAEKEAQKKVDEGTEKLISAMPKNEQPQYRTAKECLAHEFDGELDEDVQDELGLGLPDACNSWDDYLDYEDDLPDTKVKKTKRHHKEEEDE